MSTVVNNRQHLVYSQKDSCLKFGVQRDANTVITGCISEGWLLR